MRRPNLHPHENAQEIGPSDQGLPGLRAPVRLAQEVGSGLGAGRLLLGSLPAVGQVMAVVGRTCVGLRSG